jgi:hypothetical protein
MVGPLPQYHRRDETPTWASSDEFLRRVVFEMVRKSAALRPSENRLKDLKRADEIIRKSRRHNRTRAQYGYAKLYTSIVWYAFRLGKDESWIASQFDDKLLLKSRFVMKVLRRARQVARELQNPVPRKRGGPKGPTGPRVPRGNLAFRDPKFLEAANNPDVSVSDLMRMFNTKHVNVTVALWRARKNGLLQRAFKRGPR